MQLIAIGGEPATGKSTLVRELLQYYPVAQPFEYGTLKATYYPDNDLMVFGTYEGADFDGTDTLAMNVITDTKEFITQARRHPDYQQLTILFEGDRLYNGSFIRYITEEHPTLDSHWYLLETDQDVLSQRHEDRGTVDTQSGSWLAGRKTKYKNLVKDYDDLLKRRDHNTPGDTAALVDELGLIIDGPTPVTQPTTE